MPVYACVYLGSFGLTILTTPVVIWWAGRIGAMDRPGARAVHKRPIPRIGGVAIFLSVLSTIILAILWQGHRGNAFPVARTQFIALLGAGTVIFAIGLVDDLKGLSARSKLFLELLAAAVLCFAGVRVSRIAVTNEYVLILGGWGTVLTILWVVGVTNAVNLSDGLDGLAAGLCSIACGAMALLAFRSDNTIMVISMLALLGSLCGFLVFNFHPARIFMGDCGSLFLGFFVATASVMCMTQSAALVGLALPTLALSIPIFDMFFAVVRRFLERRSVFTPDRRHFHHRLLDSGLPYRHAVMAIYLASLLATGLGMFMIVSETIGSLAVLGGVLLLISLLFRVVGVIEPRRMTALLQSKCACSRRQRREREVFEHVQLQLGGVYTADQWRQVIGEAARQMDFAWITLKTTYPEGQIREEIWRAPPAPPNLSRIITMTIPLPNRDAELSRQLELAIRANGSVESAAHRGCLFGRLLDECQLPSPGNMLSRTPAE